MSSDNSKFWFNGNGFERLHILYLDIDNARQHGMLSPKIEKCLITSFVYQHSMQRRSLFACISVLVVALLYSPLSAFMVNALPPDPNYEGGTCSGITTNRNTGQLDRTCCWTQTKEGSKGVFKPRAKYCQTCSADAEGKFTNCSAKRIAEVVSDEPPTPPPTEPSGPFVLPADGVLHDPTTPPSDPAAPLQDGVLQQPPADQGATELRPPTIEDSQPATVEQEPPVPVCQEGLEFNEDLGFCVPAECPVSQELNEETGLCVLEEQEEAVEEQPAEEPSNPQSGNEEQTTDQGDSSEENSND